MLQIIAFDELKTDYKNPIDQCNSLNPLVLPEYLLHAFFNILFLVAGEWFSLLLNAPLIAYHVHRYLRRPVMSGPGKMKLDWLFATGVAALCRWSSVVLGSSPATPSNFHYRISNKVNPKESVKKRLALFFSFIAFFILKKLSHNGTLQKNCYMTPSPLRQKEMFRLQNCQVLL